jgi:hypothetical protein
VEPLACRLWLACGTAGAVARAPDSAHHHWRGVILVLAGSVRAQSSGWPTYEYWDDVS